MATFDMTAKATAGVGANIIAVPTVVRHPVRTIEAILDIDAMIAAVQLLQMGMFFNYWKSLLNQLFFVQVQKL